MNVEGLQSLLTTAGFGLVAYAGTFGAWFVDQAIDEEWAIREELDAADALHEHSKSKRNEFTTKYKKHIDATDGSGPKPADYESQETIKAANALIAEASIASKEAEQKLERSKRLLVRLEGRRRVRTRVVISCSVTGVLFLLGAAAWMLLEPSKLNP